MNELNLQNYNLEKTLLGGQAFNWDYINGSYYGFTTDKVIKITPVESGILWQTYPEENNQKYIVNMLNLNHDFDTILNDINKDEYVDSAIKSIKNVRLLKQDFEQTVLSFILTAHKNIKAVRKVVRELSKTYGNKITVDNLEFYTFPKAEILAEVSEDEIKKAGAGFRAKYIAQAAKALTDNKTLEQHLLGLSEEQARNELIKFNGIGDKVADCILTFSLGFYTVTPIDIWAFRVLTDLYKVDTKAKYSVLRRWYFDYFGQNTAWAGQFLFEYLRDNYKSIKNISNLK